MVSFERAVRQIAQDGSLAWIDVAFAHFSFVGHVNDQSVMCHATLGTPGSSSAQENLVLRPGDPSLIRSAGKSQVIRAISDNVRLRRLNRPVKVKGQVMWR